MALLFYSFEVDAVIHVHVIGRSALIQYARIDPRLVAHKFLMQPFLCEQLHRFFFMQKLLLLLIVVLVVLVVLVDL